MGTMSNALDNLGSGNPAYQFNARRSYWRTMLNDAAQKLTALKVLLKGKVSNEVLALL